MNENTGKTGNSEIFGNRTEQDINMTVTLIKEFSLIVYNLIDTLQT